MEKVRVGIIGHTGSAGLELQRLIAGHPRVEVVYWENSGEKRGKIADVELVFSCTPKEVSREKVPPLLAADKKVIDFSRWLRIDAGAGCGLPVGIEAVYGLPELGLREEIRNARLVANPGCYSTTALIPLGPIARHLNSLIIDAISGISGSNKKPTGIDNVKAYKVGYKHDHVSEMEHRLRLLRGLSSPNLPPIFFTPQVAENMERGILLKVYATVSGLDGEKLNSIYRDAFEKERFVKVMPEIDKVETKNVLRTNDCHFSFRLFGNMLFIVSTTDNLMKGAAGQAIQNMNLMYGFAEETGLA